MGRKLCLVALLCALLLGAQALEQTSTGSELELTGRKVLYSHGHDEERTCCKWKKRCKKWRKKCWWDEDHHWQCKKVCKKWRKYCFDWCDEEPHHDDSPYGGHADSPPQYPA